MFTSLLKRPSVRQNLMDRVNQGQTAKAQAFSEKLLRTGGFTAVCVGTGAPTPSQRAQPCVAVFVNGRFFLFDAGDGCVKTMGQHDIPIGLLDAVFLTHYHSDHIADLGEVINRS